MTLASVIFLVAVRLVLFFGAPPLVHASPLPDSNALEVRSTASNYWVNNIARQGTSPWGPSGYQVFRNVQAFGAKGDGVTDDTAAINSAISSGNRCGQGCDSSTVTPALVYFPPGTYMVSSPIIQYYFTQLVGDALTIPRLKATSKFQGMAVIDSDPYQSGGANWYTNQNNFYRQVRNFVIDLTALPQSTGTAIHWQVAQATSLQNIVFQMVQGGGTANKQTGIFMDNGSGGFMTDLTFNGGNQGMFLGNQQFETKNLTFNGCNTGIYMNWNWVWQIKSAHFSNCGVGIDMTSGGTTPSVGSVSVLDSSFPGTPIGIKTNYNQGNNPATGSTLLLDNVDFTNCATAVQDNGQTSLNGNQVVSNWAQGRAYVGTNGVAIAGNQPPTNKSASLLSNGKFFERSKPQYEGYSSSAFVSVKSHGAKGDGSTDDTAAIQNAMNSVGSGQILYFDHGAYIVTNTINVPNNIKITGEIWPMIMAKGANFQNQNAPIPVFKVGQAGQTGNVEISDLVFQTQGSAPGAIMMEWNVAGSSQGAAGIWDVHWRMGGSAGTNLQDNTCAKNASSTTPNTACEAAFMLLHVTKTGSIYVENAWLWVADHDLDSSSHNQVDVYNGRGVLIESTSASWFYGTSSEHSSLYNYNVNNAQNVFFAMAQTETPYYQSNPVAGTLFAPNSNYGDPSFPNCAANDKLCRKSWGMRINNSQNVLVYGIGMYSFYDNYDQTCLNNQNCQTNMINIISSSNVILYAVNTKAATNMVSLSGVSQATDAANRNGFCATLALWKQS